MGSLRPVPLLLILLFIVVPLVELYVIIQIGQAIGLVPTLFLLLLDAVLGAWLLRTQGRAAWVRFNRALAEGRVPAKEVLDGVLVIFGGALLLTPGFLTDIVGVILLIPPTRAAVRGILRRLAVGRLALGGRAAYWGYGRVRDRRAAPRSRPQPAPGPGPEPAAGEQPPPRRPAWGPDEDFGWTNPSPSSGPRPDDIEGTGHEVDDDEQQLPPGERGVFPG
jgi:UPF0716 protein FxsA